jgi:hypothetical protein
MNIHFFPAMQAVRSGRFFYLAASLMLYLLLAPWAKETIGIAVVYRVSMTLILILAVHAVGETGFATLIAALVAVAGLVVSWLSYARPSLKLDLASDLIMALFFGYVIFSLLKFVFKAGEVTRNVLFAAVSVYLLIGVFWSLLFSILEILEPGSFKGVSVSDSGGPQDLVYFSYVTLTTLGYGDITPETAKAGSLAATEAIVGQIYMTVLVAWLVGLYVSRKADGKGE